MAVPPLVTAIRTDTIKGRYHIMNQLVSTCKVSRQTHQFWLVFLVAIIASLFLLTSNGFTESTTVDVIPDETVDGSVELTPGYIAGTVDLGGQSISRIYLNAQSTDYSAKINPTAEGQYSMTVNVPAGGSLDYRVTGYAYMDSYKTLMYFQDRTTTVDEGMTSQVDIIIDSGYVLGEIVSNGCGIAKTQLVAYLNDGTSYSRTDYRGGSESTFRFPVQPNDSIDVYGQVQLTNGATVALASKYVDIVPGMETSVSWELNCGPGQLGAIQHDVNYHMPIDYNYSYLYYNGAWSPSRTARHAGSHLFDNIAPGDWRIYTYSYWNGGRNYIGKDLRDISVPSGGTVNAPIDEVTGFLQGNVTLTGTKTIQDAYSAYTYAYGKNSLYPSYRSHSRAGIDADGNYNLALPHGEWSAYMSTFFFYNTAAGEDYLYSNLNMYDYDKYYSLLYIDSGQTITGYDLNYETGSATITYSRSDGGSFSSPYLYATYYNRDETGRLKSYVYINARGASASDKVTFVGFPGTYEVDAWATVDGSNTTFGKVTIEIVAGVEKVVDIGGPALNVATPEAGTVFEENLAVVSGTATDDTAVESVTVNGISATLVSTNNPDDPNEVSFSVEIELIEGENAIDTVAVDTSGNQSSDSRSVTYEIPEVEVPEVTDITAAIDIKPGSCKNPFNVKAKGVLPVVILGGSWFDISEIDPSSILLEGVEILRSSVEDMTGGDCSKEQPDGYDDLTLKFDRQAITSAIGSVNDGDVITLTLTGTLFDGTEISGEDIITVLVKGKKKK